MQRIHQGLCLMHRFADLAKHQGTVNLGQQKKVLTSDTHMALGSMADVSTFQNLLIGDLSC